jgi:hypothetical protein
MATEGKALSRGCLEGSRPRLNNKRRGKFAFGLRSIAVARPCGTRSGLRWELADPEPCGLGRRVTRGRRWRNRAVTKVRTDFACAIIRRRPFRHRCAGGAGHRRGGASRLLTPPACTAGARGPPARIGQVNRLLGGLRRIRLRRTGSRSLQTECALWQDVGTLCLERNIAASSEPGRRRIINQGGSIR